MFVANAQKPIPVFSEAVVLFLSAQKPTAVLFDAKFLPKACLPTAVLLLPLILE